MEYRQTSVRRGAASLEARTSQPTLPPLTTSRILHLVTVPPNRSMNEHVLSRAGAYRGVGDTSRAIAQINPESSRAIAVATFGLAFPRATRRRKRVVSRSWAFHAMSQTTFGRASCRYA